MNAASREGPIRIGVVGATGRMGRAVLRLATEDPSWTVGAAIASEFAGRDAGELAGLGAIGVPISNSLDALARAKLDALVDFSLAPLTADLARAAAAARVPLVSGTTGIDSAAFEAFEAAALSIPVFWSANMSLGVHVLTRLVADAARLLGESFDAEITEVHHRKKEDAPSGTALRLANAVTSVRHASSLVHGREGRPGARKASELGMHALRGGDVIGDHTVFFFGDGERIELTHKASTRDLFARGALRAAAFVVGKKPGRYGMDDLAG